jgi:hypothetical protein
LAQLALVFVTYPENFKTDEEKIVYSISYLRGDAAAWFEPEILGTTSLEPVRWATDFEAFWQELEDNFGSVDSVVEASRLIFELTMGKDEPIRGYNVLFNTYAAQLRWNDRALLSQYYRGLAERLKDELARVGQPTSLSELRSTATRLDERYWTRQNELNYEEVDYGYDSDESTASTASTSFHSCSSGSSTPRSISPTPSNDLDEDSDHNSVESDVETSSEE